ncbi:TIGR04086 family membrane protein [Oceanobacillus kimchii]|uniref:Membrane protein YrzE n=1 Tax=Oceanobacillus kimchii TaxID=746691 RepID=A0ABQ5TLS3_9BACI|nr:TIGR04086 family membrane protein [Oceanobacillus kimchii]GLO66689.1 putative membrane protein YrzE [Oceanobacillus kimchii]
MNRNQWTALLYGWIALFGILIIASFILALLLNFTEFSESALSLVTLIIGIVALFIGGLIAGLKGKNKGWMIGAMIGVGFTLLIFLVQYLGYQQGFSLKQTAYHSLYLGVALIGGIIGVNLSGTTEVE